MAGNSGGESQHHKNDWIRASSEAADQRAKESNDSTATVA